VLLVQFLAICDSAFGAASLLCPTGIVFGVLALSMGPLAFLVVATRFVSKHVTAGDLSFEYNKRPSFDELRRKFAGAKGIIAKIVTANAWYEEALDRGSWEDSQASAWWGFLISDLVGPGWSYSAWLLIKKIWLTAALHTVDGVANVVLVISAQTVDAGALLYLRPYASRKQDITEVVGALLNLLAFIAVSLPTILNPDIPVPEFLGTFTTMILATLATALSAAASLMSPVALLIRFLFIAVREIRAHMFICPMAVKSQLLTAAFQKSKADITSGIADELQAQTEEAYISNDQDGQEQQDVEVVQQGAGDVRIAGSSKSNWWLGNFSTTVLSLLGLGAAAAAAATLHASGVNTGYAVGLELELAMAWDEMIGKEHDFERGIASDVAACIHGHANKVRVLSVQPSSFLVRVAIEEGICAQECSALEAANMVKEQAQDPNSRLFQGKFTQHTISVTVMVAKRSDDSCFLLASMPMLPIVKDTLRSPSLITSGSFALETRPHEPATDSSSVARPSRSQYTIEQSCIIPDGVMTGPGAWLRKPLPVLDLSPLATSSPSKFKSSPHGTEGNCPKSGERWASLWVSVSATRHVTDTRSRRTWPTLPGPDAATERRNTLSGSIGMQDSKMRAYMRAMYHAATCTGPDLKRFGIPT